jgi:hypothetical protein
VIVVDRWLGIVSNASPYALPPGAAVVQHNLQAIAPGQLTPRPGITSIAFSSADSTSSPICAAFRYQYGTSEHLVYQDTDGKVYSSVRTGTS